MSWDACQRQVLEALGHTLYRLADAEVPASSVEPAIAEPGGVAPVVAAAKISAPVAADRAALTALQRAVLRAADRHDPSDGAIQPLLATAQQLHANPAAKRALWPRLRALRRKPV